jgi:gliding motility-associated-like protein
LSPNISLCLIVACLLCWCFQVRAQVSVTNATDCGFCNGQAEYVCILSPSSTVEWSNLTGYFSQDVNIPNSTIAGLCPGVYLVTESFLDQSNSEYVVVGSDLTDLPQVVEVDVCADQDPVNLLGLLNTAEAGTWLDPLLQAHNGMFDPDVDLGGLYTFEIDENGCTVSSGVFVNVNNPANAGLGTTYLICETYNTFFLTNLMSGSPDFGGTWYNEFFQVVDGFYDPATMDSQLFTYIIDNVPGCPAEFSTMYVIENQLLDPGEDSQVQVCPNALPFNMTAALDGNPDQSGSWYDDSFDPVTEIFDPLTMLPGEYAYLVPGDSPCPSLQASLDVTFTLGISAGDDAAITLCSAGAPIDLYDALLGNPTTGGVWTDDNGDLIEPQVDPTIIDNGQYTYTVSAVGCQPDAAIVTVVVENQLTAGPNQNLSLCEPSSSIDLGDMLHINADLGGVWTNINNAIIDPVVDLVPNTVVYYYYNQNNPLCPNSIAQYGITTDPLPPSGADLDLVFCDSEPPVDLSQYLFDDEGFNSTFTDQDGIPAPFIFNPSDGMPAVFLYMVLSENTCPDTEIQMDVEVETLAFDNFNLALEFCSSNNPVLLVDEIDQLNGLVGSWYDENNMPIDGIFNPTTDTSSTALFIVDNGNVCPPSLATIEIDVVQLPDVGPDQALSMCVNANEVDLQTTLTGGNVDGGQWTFNGSGIDGNFDPTSNEPGVYVYEIPAFGPCPGTEVSVDVSVDMGVAVYAGADTSFCASTFPVQLGAAANTGYSYQWSPEIYLSDGEAASPVFSFDGDVNTSEFLEFVVMASNGTCDLQDTVLVEIFGLPQVDLGPDLTDCQQVEITLSANSNGVDYSWTPALWFANPNAVGQTFELMQSGTVEVQVTNDDGCVSSDEIFIEVLDIPHVNFDANPIEGCSPLSVQLFNTSENDPFTSYVWLFEDGTSTIEQDPTFVFLEEGLHNVSLAATSANGCSHSLTYFDYIEVHPSPLAFFETNLDEQTVINPVVYFDNFSVGGTGYLWTFADWGNSLEFEPIVEFPSIPDASHHICLEVINQFGCIDSICRDIFIPGEFWIFAPNAFTPDGDGINDVFIPIVRGYDPETYTFSVFSRWGEMIFSTTDPNMPWVGDNKQGNHFVQDEVFIWQVVVNDAYSAETMKFTGHVSIIR